MGTFDFAMAKYVRLSFIKSLKINLKKMLNYFGKENNKIDDYTFETSYKNYHMNDAAKLGIKESLFKKAYEITCADVEDETFQAMEAVIHNFCSLHSRSGSQVPFSSLNYGMDISPEGQLVQDKLLDATWNGLGNGETPIFPIQVFSLKTGVNYRPEDPGYWLFQKACKVSAKRLFPNFLNQDAPYNAQYYKEGNRNSYVATMG